MEQSLNVEQTIRAYITQIIHMSLATTADGKPWVCEVRFMYDDDLNLYLRTMPSSRHGEEIAANPQVAGNIVTQHFLDQPLRGVYYEGRAELLRGVDERHPAYQAYCHRFGDDLSVLQQAEGNGPKFYKITVSDWYLFDSYVSKPPQKYHLPWKT
jgi:uncharacterized protein YhbP (UPF0306 family)